MVLYGFMFVFYVSLLILIFILDKNHLILFQLSNLPMSRIVANILPNKKFLETPTGVELELYLLLLPFVAMETWPIFGSPL